MGTEDVKVTAMNMYKYKKDYILCIIVFLEPSSMFIYKVIEMSGAPDPFNKSGAVASMRQTEALASVIFS